MLEFIVLGQIPGTHVRITITWLLFATLLLVIWLDIKIHNPRLKRLLKVKRNKMLKYHFLKIKRL